ncbi:hypothetical protein FP2506_16399 [Fulvimarina pelagi HTCC2506]|uniref:DUF808 domain-containing protein n=2 Tax=Fulvimarina pelagi TaxID=217511 RepID=Q0G300_9HYPH|nr:DUF808 domain-containing protein [Fulvimarina pelagi]EAU42031.1 hypothetical protein FP2506_16399 [Fulvimarina pelagi HTCC2506]BAT31002.1 transmembrane protein [Fulvimarina pelagi]
MSVGLIALLDDISAIAKVAVSSLDDVGAQAAKAGSKAAGVVIDDAAVTPRYVTGFKPERELPIIWRITLGSLKNKLLFLLPVALLLSEFAPWAITPLLMLGGFYLCYEGAEKVFEWFFPHKAHSHEKKTGAKPEDPQALEDQKVKGAISTDFILSAEIMAITLAGLPDDGSLLTRAAVLAIVAIAVTVGVYGTVAIIVKMDDIGLAMAKSKAGALLQSVGRGIVVAMPYFLKLLGIVGTAAMIWVGGGILVHGLAEYGRAGPEHFIEGIAERIAHGIGTLEGFLHWLVTATGSGLIGLGAGLALIPIVGKVIAPLYRSITGKTADAAH